MKSEIIICCLAIIYYYNYFFGLFYLLPFSDGNGHALLSLFPQ